MTTIYGEGWVCQDCTMLEASGDTPPDMTAEETEAYLARIATNLGHLRYHLGGTHEPYCTDDDEECGCMHDEFSWTSCDVCGSTLGGSRERVFFTQPG